MLEQQIIENIECLVEKKNSSHAIVLLHGYGADCHDLAPLKDAIKAPVEVDWYFFNGIESVNFGPFMPPGRAWFPINMEEMQGAMAQGRINRYFEQKPQGFDRAAEMVTKAMNEIKLNYDDIFLGGFSQGSMIASEVAFNMGELIKGLIIMSGTFVDHNHWIPLVEKNKAIKVFQSHGYDDPILPFEQAKALADFLSAHTLYHEFHPFSGGHEIPFKVIEQINQFLDKRFAW